MSAFDFNELNMKEWRDLGFYYEYDDEKHQWDFYGDKRGLMTLTTIIDEYMSFEENKELSEHIHLGPYQYLKVVTWKEPEINEQGLFGTFLDLNRFVNNFRDKVQLTSANDQFVVGEDYSNKSISRIVVHVMPDGFDPSSMDDSLMAIRK